MTHAWAQIDTLVLPKRGHTAAECEDAVAVDQTDTSVTVAMADGATEAAFSRAWADALVEASVALAGEEADLRAAVGAAREPFQAALARRRTGLPWYAAQKAEAGAFAALLLLRVEAGASSDEVRVWHAEAVGDVTLFHLRGGALQTSWPLADATAFDSRPALVPSALTPDDLPILRTAGTWTPGDVLLVATDALAAHLLAEPDALPVFAALDPAEWKTYLVEARKAGMKNDDVALVRLRLGVSAR